MSKKAPVQPNTVPPTPAPVASGVATVDPALFATGGLVNAMNQQDQQPLNQQQNQQVELAEQVTEPVTDPFERLRAVFRGTEPQEQEPQQQEPQEPSEEEPITLTPSQLQALISEQVNAVLNQAGMEKVLQNQQQQQPLQQPLDTDPLAPYNERIKDLQELAKRNEQARYMAMQQGDEDAVNALYSESIRINEEMITAIGQRAQVQAFHSQRSLEQNLNDMRNSFVDSLRSDFSIPSTHQDFDNFLRHYQIEHLVSPEHAAIFQNPALRRILTDAAGYRYLVDGLNRTAAPPAPAPSRAAVQTQGMKPAPQASQNNVPEVSIDFLINGSPKK